MELKDQKDSWHLAFQDGLLQLIQIDFRLGLFLSDASGQTQLFVETPCRLRVRLRIAQCARRRTSRLPIAA
jgi:hypothetical protein